MKKKMEGNVCSQCGGAIDRATSSCSVCGSAAPEQASVPVKKKKGCGFWRVFFSVIFGLLLTVSFVLLELLLFIHALNENVTMPSLGLISGDWIETFFESGYSFFLGGVLVLLPMLIIVLINTNRIRRFFFTLGCSAVGSAIISAAATIVRIEILKVLPGEWQDILVNATAVFRDFGIVCAIILAVFGVTCISIYSCVAAVKGGKHEKDT